MRNVHIVLLTKTVLNWIKFNSSKQNSNFSKYIPRERGGQPCVACPGAGMRTFPCICRGQPAAVLLHLTTGIFPANAGITLLYIVSTDIRVLYSPRTRGSSHGAEVRHEIHHIPRECGGQPTVACPGAGMRTFPLRKQGCPILADIGNLSIRLPPALAGMFRRAPNSNNLLRFEFPVRGVGSQKQMPLSTYHAFSLLSQSWLKRKEEGCPVGARLALHWQGPFNRQ